MLLDQLARASLHVSSTDARLEKVDHLARVLARLERDEIPVGVAWLSGDLPQGRIGVGPATIREALSGEGSGEATLTLREVDATFGRIASLSGPGSGADRVRLLRELLGRVTPAERDFLVRLLVGELRQGAQEGVMLDAVARAASVPASSVRRAVMLTGDPGAVARRVLEEGGEALAELSIRLFRPVKPMLAQTADGVADALERLGRAAVEHKFDGARLQVHKRGEEVRIFTRRLNEETAALPELVEAVRELAAEETILDGEALALGPEGRPRRFQDTMRRFGRVRDVGRLRRDLPLVPFFFDCLYLEGRTLIDLPASERFEALSEVVPDRMRAPRIVTDDPEEAAAHLRAALETGHEGVMAKALDAPYVAGRRGASWLKVKPVHTLDLVVLAAEWGHGRRRGWLSNLHLGARDAGGGGFVMVGKTFKGMTDAMLQWQTERLQELERDRDGNVVRARPELVVEVAFDGVQRSPRYDGGLALRFARVKAYREDKDPGEADTIQTVRAIYEGRVPPG